MSQNLIQFQHGMSLDEFMRDYGTEAQCHAVLFRLRWPSGFCCPECGCHQFSLIQTRHLYQCQRCRHQQSLRSGTLLQSSRLPLRLWFLASYLLSQSKTGIAALDLKRQLGVNYKTAWLLKQKLMQAMLEREAHRRLAGRVEVDDAYLGGRRSGKRGRGAAHKQAFVAAVSTTSDGKPRRLVLTPVKGFRRKVLDTWGCEHLAEQAWVMSDRPDCFTALKNLGHIHEQATGGRMGVQNPKFNWVNTVLSNIKNALTGTHHAMRLKYAGRYLAEFQYRLNRRTNLQGMLIRLARTILNTPPAPEWMLRGPLAEAST